MSNTKNVYCRLCAKLRPHNELTDMQTDEETRQKVVNKLLRFNIEMDFQENICVGQNDGYIVAKPLPKTVCVECVKSLEEAFTFVTAVEQAQAFLTDFLIKTGKHNNCGDITLNLDRELINFKVENNCDPMYDNDDETNLGEDYDDDNVCNNDDNAVEEKNDIKDNKTDTDQANKIKENESLKLSKECKDNHINVKENNYITEGLSAFTDKLMKGFETEHNCEEIPPSNNTDYIPPELNSTVYSEEYINNQINRLREIPVEVKMTWMEYEWKCSHCGTLFPNIEELQKHSIMYHSACNAYHCTDCKIKTTRLNDFIKHVRRHVHRRYLHYSCYKCFEKFPKIDETRQHKMEIHENSKYICLGCNTPFSSNAELDEHVAKYYKILSRTPLINADNLTCSRCNRTFAHITALRNHLNTHKPTKRDYICEKCGKGFDSKPKLKNHMNTHNERRLYHCEICKTSFKSVNSLRFHGSIHSGIKPFTCDVCNKSFRNKSQIRNHMIFHSDYFPFPCPVCPKKFRTDKNLQNHMHQHTGAKPFSCDICPRDFTNLSNRNKHMRRRHGIEMAKKRQPIIKQLTADDPSSSGRANEDVKLTDLDKMNVCTNTIKDHRKSKKLNNKFKNVKVDT